MNKEKEHSIRFINSSYDTLFHIPDGGIVEVRFPDSCFTAKCEYIDDYHTRVGNTIFHICEFAEHLEGRHGSVQPEPEVLTDQAAWQLGHKEFLALQRTDTGFDYTIYTDSLRLIDGGQIDDPSLSMKEAREQILESCGFSSRNRFAVSYTVVSEQASALEQSLLAQLNGLKGSSSKITKIGKEKTHVGEESR